MCAWWRRRAPFFTHPRFLPGARVSGTRFNRSILAEGSVVLDSTVEESIVGVRSVLHRATIRRSLLMGADPYPPEGPPGAPPLGIGEGSLIQDTIERLVTGLKAGQFFILPGTYCETCEYRVACRREHQLTWWRSYRAPESKDLRSLRAIKVQDE